jgi:hypothetical protein
MRVAHGLDVGANSVDLEELADDVDLTARGRRPSDWHAKLWSIEARPEAAGARRVAADEGHDWL